MCQITLLLASFIATETVNADSIIPPPQLPSGGDIVRLPDGFQCSSGNSPSAYIDAGIFQNNLGRAESTDKDYGGYVRILIPIGGGADRVDCNKLYEYGLRERELEKSLMKLKSEVFQ